MAEMESEHKQVVDKLKERQTQLVVKIDDLTKELDISAQELEKHKGLQQDYRKLLNDILIEKKRNSVMSQSSVDSSPTSASIIMTGTSRTELTSDYGDHDTLDKELAQADSEDEEEPDHTALIAELKSRLSVVDTVEHTRVVRGLRQELEEVRSAYEEDTSELQKTLMEVKSQLLDFSRQRSVSESSGSETTKDETESQQSALEKVKNLQNQITKQNESHKELIQLLDTEQTLSTERERRANELTVSLQELQKNFNEQSLRVESLTAEITQVNSKYEESCQQLAVTERKVAEAEKTLSESEGLVKSITAERDSALRDVAEARDKLRTLSRQHDALVKETEISHREEVQGLKKDNSEYLTIIQHLKDQVSESEASISTYLLQITSFQQKLEAASKDSDKAKRAKAAVDRDFKEMRNEVNVISRQKQEAKDKLAEVTEMLNQLQSDYENLKARKNSLAPETEAVVREQTELIQALEARLAEFEARPGSSADPGKRLRSGSLSGGRWSNGTPTPPPTMPLPPLPSPLPNPPPSPLQANFGRTSSTGRSLSRTNSQDQLPRSTSRDQLRSPAETDALKREIEEKELKIANLEKQFQSERQLVQTLEEALSDTEKSMKQLKKQTNSLAAEKEMLHTKMLDVSHQLEIAKKEAAKSRDSIQQLDEARTQRAKVHPHPRNFVLISLTLFLLPFTFPSVTFAFLF
jgi:predicted  nucleic acid-binding Zn-ribbon protein